MKISIFLLSSIIILHPRVNSLNYLNASIDINTNHIFKSSTEFPNAADIPATGKTVTPEMYGAIGDGTEHKLSEKYKTLAEAQKVYPGVVDLNITIDGAAFQKAVDMASLDNGEVLAEKNYVTNSPIVMKDNVIVDGNNKGSLKNDRSRGKMLAWAFLFGDHAPYGFNKEQNNGAGYTFYDVKESMKVGQNYLTLSNPADASSFKKDQIVMVVSSFKRNMNISKVKLPFHITMCKITQIEGSKLSFEYPFDENVDSVQISANGNYDNHTGINFGGVQNVTLRNMTIDATQISGSEYAYKCHIDNIKLIGGVRLVGMNAMAYSTFTNITGTFSWRGIEIKTGSHNLLVKNIHGTYQPIEGYPQPVDAISIGQYNRSVTVDSFDFNFGNSSPKISTINFRSRKVVISNGTITCPNLTNPFVKFYNEHYIDNPSFGCYGNTLKNVRFTAGENMNTLFEMGDGAGINKDKPKDNWVTQKKMAHRAKPVDKDDDKDMSEIFDAVKTADVPPQANIIENCIFHGGGLHSKIKLNSGKKNIIRNCDFQNASIKVSNNFESENTLQNNILKEVSPGRMNRQKQ
ncbi:MAG: hypothetical protein JSU03_03720 [Bacteroidetes bacterium]|nr:hypothetical protein [Bacteroidota bacterium]MBS1756364.1 hypothetical protein [Bacteroidota bacterium]